MAIRVKLKKNVEKYAEIMAIGVNVIQDNSNKIIDTHFIAKISLTVYSLFYENVKLL